MLPQMEKERAAARGATVVRRAACLAPAVLRVADSMMGRTKVCMVARKEEDGISDLVE